MKFSDKDTSDSDQIEMAAAEWLARIDDGLSGEEQDAYVEWLAQDERHRQAISLMQWGWEEMDRLAGLQLSHKAPINPKLLAPDSGMVNRAPRKPVIIALIGIAALLLLSFTGIQVFNKAAQEEPEFQPAYELMVRLVNQRLPDGTTVELNRGAVIKTSYTKAKRLVHLEGGEANFIVAKDSSRPFVVSVGGIEVKAVGTIFNVKYVGKKVDVIVTEGQVQVDHEPGFYLEKVVQSATPLLTAGQKATIQIEPDRPTVTLETLDREDMEDALKWQPRLLKFNAAPLADIIAGFNRHNQIQVELGDPKLGQIVLTSAFWSDNVEGFVRLMENNFGMQIVWVDREKIRLVAEEKLTSSL